MILIDTNKFNSKNSFIIVKHPTMVLYSIGDEPKVEHRCKAEGFIIILPYDFVPLHRCMDSNKLETDHFIDEVCEYNLKYIGYKTLIRNLRFDVDRINEIREKWWPVVFELSYNRWLPSIHEYPVFDSPTIEEKWGYMRFNEWKLQD